MRKAPSILMIVFLFGFVPTACWSGNNDSSGTGSPAHIIDDFSDNAVNPAKWTLTNNKPGRDVFSQSGGRLNFSATAGGGVLQSAHPFGPGFYTMQFFNYASTNEEEPESHKGAFVGLGLGPKDNYVRIIRCQNGRRASRRTESQYVGVFEANYIDNAKGGIQVHYERTQTSSGRLGLYYDGSKVTFYFNPSPDSDTGWRTIKRAGGDVLQWNPHWTEPPLLFIRGFDPSGTTSFKADNVEYRPGPPAAN